LIVGDAPSRSTGAGPRQDGRVEPETFEALLSDAGQRLLAEVTDLADDHDDLTLGSRLRRGHPPELVSAAISQHRLRRKAVAKLGEQAEAMYFTPDALQQLTRAAVADHRARRLRGLGVSAVVDLGCGVGGDLIACARAGLRVRGVEIDPLRAAMAEANLAALGLNGDVEVRDAVDVAVGAEEVAFIDPARRDARGRISRLDRLTPPWSWVGELLSGRAVAKLMPGIAHADVPGGVHAEWISHSGDLVEACLWGAGLADGGRSATVLPSGERLVDRGVVAGVDEPRRFIVEPDDAVIRAGLVAELGELIDGALLDPRIAYLTCDTPPTGALGRWFDVIEELPFRPKALRAALRERDLGQLTVKKRGVEIVPERLIAQLKATGSTPATLLLTRVAGTGRAFHVRPTA